MPLLRLLLAGLIALFAFVAVAATAVLVLVSGLIGWVAQLFGVGRRPVRRAPPGRPTRPMQGDVIDVETTPVPDDKPRD